MSIMYQQNLIQSCFKFPQSKFKRLLFRSSFNLRSYIKDRRRDNNHLDLIAKIDNQVLIIQIISKIKYRDCCKVSKRTKSLVLKMIKMFMEEKQIQKFRRK